MVEYDLSELPMIARSLCKEAVEVGMSLTAGADEQALQAETEKFFGAIPELIEPTLSGEIEAGGFDLFEMFDRFAQEGEIERHLTKLDAEKDDSLFNKALLDDADPQIIAAFLGSLLISSVQILKQKEIELLEITEAPNWEEAMKHVDTDIHQLAAILSSAKAFNPGIEYLSTKLTRSAGAKKGGKARSEKYQELRGAVIEEAQTLHKDKTGAEAARQIFRKWGPENAWLKDEKGTSILTDPVATFTKWINQDRKRANPTSKNAQA